MPTAADQSHGNTSVDATSRESLMNWIRFRVPTMAECGIALVAAGCLIASFPNLDVWLLAWVALVPLLLLIARRPSPWPQFFLGWLFGAVFFYGTCYWLTYSMIHFAGISRWIAFPMLVPGAMVLGLFPALFSMALAWLVRQLGVRALLLAPVIWPSLEWARLETTGQLWNALGYSQAYQPALIQIAKFGGIYAVGFLIIAVNTSLAYLFVRRNRSARLVSSALLALVAGAILISNYSSSRPRATNSSEVVVIAIQPNVPMDLVKSPAEMAALNARHFEMSETVLSSTLNDGSPKILIWPESPMYFTYGADSVLREKLQQFAKTHRTSILLNSQEQAPNDGIYNSAVLINEEGSLVSQYDKIRLLPFGEYVPLPAWLPGAGLIRGIVGDFTAGSRYRLMPVGDLRAGVFICIESAYPDIARQFTHDGADVLINISNDGYLGPTAVLRQHLANAVFRAVESNRPLLRVTNTGITARISERGELHDVTRPFQQEVRVWRLARTNEAPAFYARYGDLFVTLCAGFSVLIFIWSLWRKSRAGSGRNQSY